MLASALEPSWALEVREKLGLKALKGLKLKAAEARLLLAVLLGELR